MHGNFEDQLAAARRGDRGAADSLFGPVRPLMELQARALIPRSISRRVSAADVVQESLAQAFCDFVDFRGSSEAEWIAWLRQIVAGHASKVVRFHGAEKRDADRDVALTQPPSAPSSDGVVRRAIKSEEAANLARAIEQLPDAMREIVIRRMVQRQSWADVSAEIGRSSGAARVMWTRAIKRLREILNETDGPSQ